MLTLKKRRKAMVQSQIIKLILLIFSFILIFSFLYQFYGKLTKHANEEACHDSLVLIQVLAEKSPTPGATYVKPWPATCKTQDRVIKTKDPEKAKKELAEMMSWCWWMMGEGVMKPFEKDWVGGRDCFVCYTAQFPELEEPIDQQDMLFYLKEKGKKGTTYYDYLKYEEDKLVKDAVMNPIGNTRVYVVVYIRPGTFFWGKVNTDGVYVTDVNYGKSGCKASWFTTEGVKTT